MSIWNILDDAKELTSDLDDELKKVIWKLQGLDDDYDKEFILDVVSGVIGELEAINLGMY